MGKSRLRDIVLQEGETIGTLPTLKAKKFIKLKLLITTDSGFKHRHYRFRWGKGKSFSDIHIMYADCRSPREVLQEVEDTLDFFWREFAQCSDKKMTVQAIELKQGMLEYFEEA